MKPGFVTTALELEGGRDAEELKVEWIFQFMSGLSGIRIGVPFSLK